MIKIKESVVDWMLRCLIILSLVGGVYTYINQQSIATCTARWADKYSTAVNARSNSNTARVDALHKLLVDAIERHPAPGTTDDPVINADVKEFVDTEANYARTVKNHPFPDPPMEVCK